MRRQLGHSPHLTVERDELGHDVFRSYETPILVLGNKNEVIFADTRIYSAVTTRHQLQLSHFRPNEYQLPRHRERVGYEYCLKQAGRNAWGELYQPLYRAKDNPYDPWHEIYKDQAWDWETAYNMLSNHGEPTEYVTANFVGTL